jgi:methionyl-tRNA formyltransferase
MKIVFMGTPDFSVLPLKALIKKHEVVCVVTGEDKKRGRGNVLSFTPVKEEALKEGLKVITPKTLKSEEVYNELKMFNADVFVVVAYGKLLPESILNLPKKGCINIHASLLPQYRGAAPIQWAIIDGMKKTGITTMLMDKGLDTGDILKQYEISIDKDETGGSLFEKLAVLGAEAIIDTLNSLDEITPRKQGEMTTDYVATIKKQDGEIDFNLNADVLERRIRGLSPWPSAFTKLDNKNLRICSAVESEVKDLAKLNKTSNENIFISEDKMFLSCKDSFLQVLELQLEGKKRMKTQDFLRGYKNVF